MADGSPPAGDGLRIGLSGWSYPSWRSGFYRGVPQRRWLAHCAAHFNAVEVNASFYRTLRPELLARWREETPADFRFAVKGHRNLTHVRRLSDVVDAVGRQRDALAPLGEKLAAVLWQCPPGLHEDAGRLEAFADALAGWGETRHVVEFRHESWFTPGTARRLAAHGIANCLSDSPRWPMWQAVTAPLVYVRLHGHTRLYASRYAAAALRRWAGRIGGWLEDGRAVQVYFDNDAEGHAPYDALRLMAMLGVERAP